MRLWPALAALCLWSGQAAANPLTSIVSARYVEPTTRYDHGVLGDAIEWGALELVVDSCVDCEYRSRQTVTHRLPESRVFEDVSPRLVDVDANGTLEAIVVETDVDLGARLAIYDGHGALFAATPFIGQTRRWLAPVGAADLDGDGFVEIAYVDRPHLLGTLRVWRVAGGQLIEVAAMEQLTNHRIGETDIAGGLRDCGQGLEMIMATADWRRIVAVELADNALIARDIGPHKGRSSFAAAMRCDS